MLDAISVLLMGPSGAGKSSFLRSVLKAFGSGAVALAPGLDEINSYAELRGKPGYVFEGFDDVGFMPSLGKEGLAVEGMNNLLRWQRGIYSEVMEDVKAGRRPRYAVFGMDTVSAMGILGYNATLIKTGRDIPPPAQSPDGAQFYTLLRQYQEQMFRIPRALKGLGVNFIALSHIVERDTTEVTNTNTEARMKSIVAAVPGGFRDVLPGYFDAVFHAGVTKRKVGEKIEDLHYLRWKPSGKRPTKSRFGSLSETEIIPNDWSEVAKRIDAAIETRANG
jgi:hypothetical protein